jgi:Patatin-like phospholipase
VILLVAAALGAAATRRLLSLMGAIGGRPVLGYGAFLWRSHVAPQDLLKLRSTGDEQFVATGRKLLGRLVERTKTEYELYTAGRRKEPPVIDILVISGGGDWGAFGAGFLKGWQKIPAQHPLAKPERDAVTGVSTGTLIAPFAFLGDEQSLEEIVNLYRNPQKDWVKQRGFLYFLPDNISFAEVPGLERESATTSLWTWFGASRRRAPTAGS